MHSLYRRILAVVLAMVMTLGLSVTAFAEEAGTQTPGQGSGSLTGDSGTVDPGPTDPEPDDPGPADPGPVGPGPSYTGSDDDDDDTLLITFQPGDGYTLEAPSGVSTLSDGSVRISLTGSRITEGKIPEAVPADAYYRITGWIVKETSGEKTVADLTDYRFTRNATVRAACQDVWPVYDDMKTDRSDWYYQYIRDLSIDGVVGGYADNTFRSENPVTWGTGLKLIMLAAGYPEQPSVDADSHPCSGYLVKAKADGLVDADLNVNLYSSMTRLQFAQVAAAALGLEAPDGMESPFIDTSDPALLALYEVGIMEGSFDADGNRLYNPDQNVKRSHIAAIVWRMNQYTKGA